EIHENFLYDIGTGSEHHISYSSFVRIWKSYLPEIQFLSPQTDLCTLCKEMRFNANFWSLAEKEQKVNNWDAHIKWANNERDNYRYRFKYFILDSVSLIYKSFVLYTKIRRCMYTICKKKFGK